MPLTDAWISGRMRWRREYLYLFAPLLIFAGVFAVTLSNHHMVRDELYAFGWHAPAVFARSLFRLAVPALLAAILILSLVERRFLIRPVLPGLAWMAITLSPYIFLTYQAHVPSRHNYVPSMGLALALAALLAASRKRRLAVALMAVVMTANVSYIWIRKDPQYEMRARPTTRLLEELRRQTPQRILVTEFPLNPWMARMCARHVPGWHPDLIEVNSPPDSCVSCPRYRWIESSGEYEAILSDNEKDAAPGPPLPPPADRGAS